MSGLTASCDYMPVSAYCGSVTNSSANQTEPYSPELSSTSDIFTIPERTKLTSLSWLSDNWDGHGSVKPNGHAIQKAMTFIKEAYVMSAANRLIWKPPHISASEEGEVVFEWWNKKSKLTVYIGQESSEYLKVWGPNMASEMIADDFDETQFPQLWSWLVG
jgi:hypothetical protein